MSEMKTSMSACPLMSILASMGDAIVGLKGERYGFGGACRMDQGSISPCPPRASSFPSPRASAQRQGEPDPVPAVEVCVFARCSQSAGQEYAKPADLAHLDR